MAIQLLIPGEEIPSAENIPAPVEETPPTKRDRGRPPGAKNKPKPKPAPMPAVKATAKKKPVEYEASYTESEEEEAPPPRRRASRAEQPVELDRRALASDVLNILQQQRYQRTTAKRNHYASWFENMQ